MAGKKDKNKPRFTGKDIELWKAMTKDVRRFPDRDYAEPGDEEPPPVKTAPKVKNYVPVKEPPRAKVSPRGKDVDRSTAQKFRRGKMEIEGTLDLHGMNQQDARDALRRFIKAGAARGRRCVLVITGKGTLANPSKLRARVPEWLAEEPLGAMVLQTARAHIRHGGEGALYVLLRRQRL